MRTKRLPERPHRGGGDTYPCIVCHKEVNRATARMVHVIDGGGTVLHPADEPLYVADAGDCGCHPIGPDCARKLGLEWSTPA